VTLASTDTSGQHATVTNATSKAQQAAAASHGLRAPPSEQASTTALSADETVHTTEIHPWLTVDRGWVQAAQLVVGERVVREDGSPATVVALQVVAGAADYYNLTVSQLHTYAVGGGQYVVHNCGVADNWAKTKTLSNGMTKAKYREGATQCDFCDRPFPEGAPKVIEHAYPRSEAIPQFSSQADADAFVADVDNFSVVCKSCNSAKGTNYPGEFTVPGRGAAPAVMQQLQNKIAIMAQRYGLSPRW
jgi:hypothetical protein